MSSVLAFRAERASDLGSCRVAQHDGSAVLGDRVRDDIAADVNHRVEMLGRACCAHDYRAIADLDLTAVGYAAGQVGVDTFVAAGLAADGYVQQTVAMEVQRCLGPGGQLNLAFSRLDHAGVVHLRAEKRNHAVVVDSDAAFVTDVAGQLDVQFAGLGELPGLLLGQEAGAGNQSAGGNMRLGPDHDAVRIDQYQLAIGRNGSIDLRRVATSHPVEGYGLSVRLVEGDLVVRAHIELLPIDSRSVAGRVHCHAVALLRDGRLTTNHLASLGKAIDVAGMTCTTGALCAVCRHCGGNGQRAGQEKDQMGVLHHEVLTS